MTDTAESRRLSELTALFLMAERRLEPDQTFWARMSKDPKSLCAEIQREYAPQFDFEEERRRVGLEALPALCRDNAGMSPEALARLAAALSPGGVHDAGYFTSALIDLNIPCCPYALAALIYENWTGGKIGFQFMPNPREADEADYYERAETIFGLLIDGGPPTRFLVGDDRDFYEGLPQTLTIYRGVSGVPFDIARSGLCWTTDRKMADWFAHRCATVEAPPMVVTARVGKNKIVMAHAKECEVVTLPFRARAIRARATKGRPDGWVKAGVGMPL